MKAFKKVVTGFILGFVQYAVLVVTIMKFWGWYVLQLFPKAMHIGWRSAFAVAMLLGVTQLAPIVAIGLNSDKEVNSNVSLITMTIITAFMLLFGWLYHLILF